MSNNNNNIHHEPQGKDDNQIIIYTTPDGRVTLDVQIGANTVWLTQEQICLLYGKAKETISEHLTHIFEEGELDPKVVVRENRTTTRHGAIEGKTQAKQYGIRLLRLRREPSPRPYIESCWTIFFLLEGIQSCKMQAKYLQ